MNELRPGVLDQVDFHRQPAVFYYPAARKGREVSSSAAIPLPRQARRSH